TGTETAVMAAAMANGTTRLLNAASEPHVQGLCHALNEMGARITGIGSNVLEIQGASHLRPARHRVGPDHIEVGSFVAVAAMTGREALLRAGAPGPGRPGHRKGGAGGRGIGGHGRRLAGPRRRAPGEVAGGARSPDVPSNDNAVRAAGRRGAGAPPAEARLRTRR